MLQWIVPLVTCAIGVWIVARRIIAFSRRPEAVGEVAVRKRRAETMEFAGIVMILGSVVPYVLLVFSPLRYIVYGVVAVGIFLLGVGRFKRRLIEMAGS